MISIITVVRNGATTIEHTILSVLSQDYPDFEYVVVDGISSDGTLNILEKYSDKIRYVSESDAGIYDAMNKGISLAKGDWIYFLGCDDLFYCKSTLSNIFLKSKDSSTYPNTQTIQTNLRITGDTYFIGKSYVSNQILVGKDSGITNTSIDISGNTIVSRLGIGTTSVNANPNSLDISGNIYQTNGGFIWQF